MPHQSQLDQPEITSLLKSIPEPLLFGFLDNPYESLIIIDQQGIVRFFCSINEQLYGLKKGEALGKHIKEINPESKLLDVLATGKAEIGKVMTLKGKQRIIARIPIVRDGQVIGAIGKLLISHPEKLKQLYDQIETLQTSLDYYKSELNQTLGSRYNFDSIIGESEPIKQVKALSLQAAETDASVLITGESGTGKELFAHAIHQAGNRKEHNFVKVNCASIPNELIESELFGYEAGSFTGANRKGKAGKFELAHQGTIFLDEIGDMPLSMQVKVLRTLQEKEIERVGGGKPKPVDFRLICATNRNLEKMVRTGEFRLDLFYRINVMTIQLPPLREIKEDIPLLFNAFVRALSHERKQEIKRISPATTALLTHYTWPGNARELRNSAERALIVAKGQMIEGGDLPPNLHPTSDEVPDKSTPPSNLKHLLEAAEKNAIIEALRYCRNKAETAKHLGIHRTGLYQKMTKYRITSVDYAK
jgi:transcriptional regulator with PAS, ATPase and Fis domain